MVKQNKKLKKNKTNRDLELFIKQSFVSKTIFLRLLPHCKANPTTISVFPSLTPPQSDSRSEMGYGHYLRPDCIDDHADNHNKQFP